LIGIEIIRQILSFKDGREKYGLDSINDETLRIYKGALLVLLSSSPSSEEVEIQHKNGKSRITLSNSIFATLKDIISGEYDADRADYLLRDGYLSGSGFGRYDFKRFIQSMRLVRFSPNERYKVVPTIRALSTLESYLIERYKLYKWVYLHHKVRFFVEGASRLGKSVFLKMRKNFLGNDWRHAKPIREDYEAVLHKDLREGIPPFILFLNRKESKKIKQLNLVFYSKRMILGFIRSYEKQS
jgi:HD superfamily phosphohydrolase